MYEIMFYLLLQTIIIETIEYITNYNYIRE